MPIRCMYLECKTEVYKSNKSLFRFPVKHPKRLEQWIQNCGNPRVKNYSKEALNCQYVCIDHFEKKFIKNEGGQRKRLTKDAVPTPYEWDASKLFADLPAESTTEEYQTSSSGGRYRKVPVNTEDLCLFEDYRSAEEASEPDPESGHQQLQVQAPSRFYAKRVRTARNTGADDVEVVQNHQCAECQKPMKGFQWWCLMCGARCGTCAVRMAHRPHFLLRAPLHATYEQTRAVLAGVLRGLGGLRAEELLAAQDVVRHVDHNGVELWHGAEPLVKAEPPAAAADPLRGADEHDADPLRGADEHDADPLRGPDEHDADPLRGADEHDADPLRGADEHDSDREDPDYRACLDALRTETLPNLPSHRDGQDYSQSDLGDRHQRLSKEDLDRHLSDRENLDRCFSDHENLNLSDRRSPDVDPRNSPELDPLRLTPPIDSAPTHINPEHSANQDSTDRRRQYRRKRKFTPRSQISTDHRPDVGQSSPPDESIDYRPSNECTSIDLPFGSGEKCLSVEDVDGPPAGGVDVRRSASMRASARRPAEREREQLAEWFSLSQSHGLYLPALAEGPARVPDKSSDDRGPAPRVVKRSRVRTRPGVNASTYTRHTTEILKSTADAEQLIQPNTERFPAQLKKIKVISRKLLEKKNIKLYVRPKLVEENDNPKTEHLATNREDSNR